MTTDNWDTEPQQWTSLTRPELIEKAVLRGEGVLSRTGALVVESITPEDNYSAERYIVEEPSTEDVIDWKRNQAFAADDFDNLWLQAETFLADKDRFVQYVHAGDDQQYYLPVKVVTQTAWQSLSALNLFTPTDEENYNNKSKREWQILNVPEFAYQSVSSDSPDNNEVGQRAVITHYGRRRILLLGMHNGGEMKKAMFTVLSFLLPEREVLPLHSSASIDEQQRVTLLVGASGAGKTTLATETTLKVIGDDEIGWGKSDLFNLEGGFYLRTSQLKAAEANEWLSPVRFGAVTENATLKADRGLDFDAEQTLHYGRCAYPFAYTVQAPASVMDVSPDYLVILVCDYTGVLPVISRLSTKAAAYHYLCGYSSVLSGNAVDNDNSAHDDNIVPNNKAVANNNAAPNNISVEKSSVEKSSVEKSSVENTSLEASSSTNSQRVVPQFRTCFTAPYLPRPPFEYADLLVKRIEQSDCQVFLMNTGVQGNGGDEMQRIAISCCQRLLQTLQSGGLTDCEYQLHAATGLDIPTGVSGFEDAFFDPASHWLDTAAYGQACASLIASFAEEANRLGIPESSRLTKLG